MPSNSHVLVVTDRNLLSPTGEWRLITSRARVLFECYGVTTHVVVIRPQSKISKNHELLSQPGLTWELLSYCHPIQFHRLLRTTLGWERQGQLAIVLSGLTVLHGVRSAKATGVPVLLDIHGDLVEWKEYPPKIFGSRIAPRLLYYPLSCYQRIGLREANACFVVSETLGIWARRVGCERVFIVPCCTSQFVEDRNRADYRSRYRQLWGLEEDHRVWMYSGGLSEWQMLPETMNLFWRIHCLDSRSRFVIATPDPDVVNRRMEALGFTREDFRVTTLPPQEVVPALCAADIGVMLRSRSCTNAASFPNKFAEYVAAGLFVIVGNGAVDPARLCQAYGIGQAVNSDTMTTMRDEEIMALIQSTSGDTSSRLQRNRSLLDRISMVNTLQPFVAFLNQAGERAASQRARQTDG